MQKDRVKIAVQSKGRLNEGSLDLLTSCGLVFTCENNALISHCKNLPISLYFVRDDDIPKLISDSICDLGIVGENVLAEIDASPIEKIQYTVLKKLDFARCRLSIATPVDVNYKNPKSLQGLRLATSYPNLAHKFLSAENVDATVLTISGSVELAPQIGMADVICDLVSTGRTLAENGLKERTTILNSEAVLVQRQGDLSNSESMIISQLLYQLEETQLEAIAC